ncbi:hypothetical protein NEMIN01_1335 [Nematocida minor]|uniref:uncharacterized protein n=1 Tax=Nematocida minor TaxID=1912983 RepID=UPI00221F2E86|nr:uncharacterized protein NEMIN01_1335 [Nematocida minor]KAI5191066.1 hypothetical protein NEMIN01_1335 [Nematocida minor]
MAVEEVKNEIFRHEHQEKKRKRVKVRKAEEHPAELAEVCASHKSVPISEYVLNSTNINHKIYRDILVNRRNGERISSLNPLK